MKRILFALSLVTVTVTVTVPAAHANYRGGFGGGAMPRPSGNAHAGPTFRPAAQHTPYAFNQPAGIQYKPAHSYQDFAGGASIAHSPSGNAFGLVGGNTSLNSALGRPGGQGFYPGGSTFNANPAVYSGGNLGGAPGYYGTPSYPQAGAGGAGMAYNPMLQNATPWNSPGGSYASNLSGPTGTGVGPNYENVQTSLGGPGGGPSREQRVQDYAGGGSINANPGDPKSMAGGGALNANPGTGNGSADPSGLRVYTRRFVRIRNESNQKMMVQVRYRALTDKGPLWVPSATEHLTYTLAPGDEKVLSKDSLRISADRLRVWARTEDGRVIARYRNDDLFLGRDTERNANGGLAYQASAMGTFTYLFK